MNRIAAIAVACSAVAYAAQAQLVMFSVSGGGEVSDWKAVDTCAAEPYAELGSNYRDREISDAQFHSVNACRLLLVGFNAGWVAAGGDPKKSPHPFLGFSVKDDFKYPLKCPAVQNNSFTDVCELDRSKPRTP